MIRKDQLYSDSRIIRKAVQEGKTTKEIIKMLSLSKNQIMYRVRTRYSERIADKIIKDLNANDEKVSVIEKEKKVFNNENLTGLVIDTSALGKEGSFEFAMGFKEVIITTSILEELEKKKKGKETLGRNVRKLLKASAKDPKGTKIKVVIAEKISDYVDDNLINFCKGKEVILYTADNALANKAKAYQIKYILAEDVPEKAKVTRKEKEKAEEKEVKEPPVQVDVKELMAKINSNAIGLKTKTKTGTATISNVSMLGNRLALTIPDTYKISYVVLDNEKVKRPIENIISLEEGNLVLVLTYKLKHGGLCVAKYEITNIAPENHSIFLGSEKLSDVDQISAMSFSEEVKREIKNYFMLVRKTN